MILVGLTSSGLSNEKPASLERAKLLAATLLSERTGDVLCWHLSNVPGHDGHLGSWGPADTLRTSCNDCL